ncbi:MBOAT family O-acyltransferase [Aureivirga marina]|uniref:MBOAT family O-acyltransferase n=1 Tax=Aureivirga marina TaxID=1182451 RepID=UPI0018CA69BB|nr:MBOAT family protein [Aureivirga marina]
MIFNSIDFAYFLPIVFILYWFVTQRNLKAQNILLLVASYIFYGWWDIRFLTLIAFSSALDYFIGLKLGETENPKKRKLLLGLSLLVNLGFLGFFKYFNFFIESFSDAFTFFGGNIAASKLNIILPVGISFYTFQTLSYTIDVYRKTLQPTKDPIAFFAFVSFFPQLVAGPIERASNLLPQFYKKRIFNYDLAVQGGRQILWGLFKKMVIADNCATYANIIFNNSDDYSGSTLLLGGVFFAFQIYGDFSGYSDIAIGTSRLFGFDLMKNFAFPYFSRDIAEFWRRWHISLSTWFRDYLYIPLGGSKGGTWMKIRNTFIIFLVSGFWHGANWTFVLWGLVNAMYFLPIMLLKRNRNNMEIVAHNKTLPTLKEAFSMIVTFVLAVLAWIIFRAENITHVKEIFTKIFSSSLFTKPEFYKMEVANIILWVVAIFMLIEWIGRKQEFAIANAKLRVPRVLNWSFYFVLVFMILIFGGSEQDFIYFQF